MKPYARRLRRFAGQLTGWAQEHASDFVDQASFEEAVTARARDMRVHGLTPAHWRAAVATAVRQGWQEWDQGEAELRSLNDEQRRFLDELS